MAGNLYEVADDYAIDSALFTVCWAAIVPVVLTESDRPTSAILFTSTRSPHASARSIVRYVETALDPLVLCASPN
ncbi:MAG: hypothetical protein MUF72_23775 [Elainella sp. Prado103]|nr:hypothetical protein [Elainella sp. Prado103]